MRIELAILRVAAWLVPGPQRTEWLAEWRSELWYGWHGSSRDKGAAIVFCLGAFKDAAWLRRNRPGPNAWEPARLQSPFQCILFLGVLAAVSLFFALRLPGPRDAILPSPYRDARTLVMISLAGHSAEPVPTVSIEQYQSLANHMQHLFTGVAFYQPARTRVGAEQLSVALASGNLLELLQIPVSSPTHTAGLVLSQASWRKYFGGDPHISGRFLEVAGRQVRVSGVISADSWRLPGRVDAWLLQDEQLARLPPRAKGFVLARMRTAGRWQIVAPNQQGGRDTFECASLDRRRPILAHLLMIAIALLILPATTSLTLGEYPARRVRLRRWIFLGTKLALILPIVFCGTLDLAVVMSAAGIQPHATLVGYVLAFRWALIDQRQRCPVCLRLLSNPTRIGQPSQTFLAWYGTEFMCVKGHGFLHVPEISISGYSTQRWLYLDPSWSSLFFRGW